jgi:DNA-binding transcriptional regulator LsrR (DeoR family)
MDRTELLAQVASLYYEENLTQAEVARRVNTSRSTVSRLLREARDAGIVEITVHHRYGTDAALEKELIARFGLRGARVLSGKGRPYEDILRGLGVVAARYMEGIVDESAIVGISWGTSIYSTVQAMQPDREMPLTVVQMAGAASASNPQIDGPGLAMLLANKYGGEYHYLHAPLLVEEARVREALLQEPGIRDTLALARKADIALLGIGSVIPEVSSLFRVGYLDREALTKLQEQGVVGDICGQHFDAHGRTEGIALNRRVIGVDLSVFKDVAHVVAVAGGRAKADCILGALRGGHIKVLVTDDQAARAVLGHS